LAEDFIVRDRGFKEDDGVSSFPRRRFRLGEKRDLALRIDCERSRGQARFQLVERHPGDLGDLDVLVGQRATGGAQEEVVHGLVHAPVLGDEPEVDGAQGRDHAPDDAGLLLDLANGGLLGGLAFLDVALGQRPEQPPTPIQAPDHRGRP
jgi:hypothetical protein